MILDNHGRLINYVRLAVTDRCNLRCFYCMPEEGIDFVSKEDLLSFEEMLRLMTVLAKNGVNKVRITGGEPFVRKDLDQFLIDLSKIKGIDKIRITTNGTVTSKYIAALKQAGIHTINLSLDTLDRQRFFEITRRDVYDKVINCLHELLDEGFQVKINMVVMAGVNDQDIIPMLNLARDQPLSVRFIEEMPFNGDGRLPDKTWNFQQIENHVKAFYPNISRQPMIAGSTTCDYSIPGFKGNMGIIAAYSRTFCGTCNRLRITPQGMLKTCLYDNGVFDLRSIIRNGASDDELSTAIISACNHRAKDGFEAERANLDNGKFLASMSTIGG